MLRHEALADVEVKAQAYSEAKAIYESRREELDAALLVAKTAGATFRELSFFSRRSVGFAQKALTRQGYNPVPREPKSIDVEIS